MLGGLGKRILTGVVSCALALGGALLAPPEAQADDGSGLWYVTDTGVAQAHEAGVNGAGVTIAEIDTPYNPTVPWLAGANIAHREAAMCLGSGGVAMPAVSEDYAETYHATDMIGFIVGNGQGAVSGSAPIGVAPAAKVLSYAVMVTSGWTVETYGNKCDEAAKPIDVAVAEAINAALDDGADIISMPLVFTVPDAEGESAYGPYGQAIARAMREGVPVVTSRTNDNEGAGLLDAFASTDTEGNPVDPSERKTALTTTRSEYFPGLLTVNAVSSAGEVQAESNEPNTGIDLAGPGVGVTNQDGGLGLFQSELSGGTSAAVAIVSAYLALGMQKWPEATGNQLLQSLVATASGGGMRTDAVGWGIANLPAFLATDPATFPDVNPMLAIDVEREWSAGEKWGWHQPEYPFYSEYTNPDIAESFGRILAGQCLATGTPLPRTLTELVRRPLAALAAGVATWWAPREAASATPQT